MGVERKRKGGSGLRHQGGDGSGRRGWRKQDTRIASARMSGSSDSVSPREKGGRLGFSSEHPSVSVGGGGKSVYTYGGQGSERQ